MKREPVTERLDRLLGLLASRDSWTAPRLADELGVNLRTVRRDLARLNAKGVPIESEPGRGGGLRVTDRTGLGRLQLGHREVLDLLLALAIVERLRSPMLLASLTSLRQKVSIAFPPEQRRQVNRLRRRVLIGPISSNRIASELGAVKPSVLRPIQDAFFAQQWLELRYASATAVHTRQVEPHHLLLSWPAWYLLVFDHLREAPRLLRLDRIESARVLSDKTFELRPSNTMMAASEDIFRPV